MKRRVFIKNLGITSLALWAVNKPVFGEVYEKDLKVIHNIPVDKQIDAKWLKDIATKTEPSTYYKSKNELQYIGMPCGGLHAGTLYVGGDGRLWLWQLFNQTWDGVNNEGIDTKAVIYNNGTKNKKIFARDGASYVEPSIADSKRMLEQGFAIKLQYKGQTIIKELNAKDWDDVAFRATYPIAKVSYIDKQLPVEISLECFSPFIPLDETNSSFPATILSIKVKNIAEFDVAFEVLGWLENGCSKLSALTETDGKRINALVTEKEVTALHYSFETDNELLKTKGDAGTMSFALINDGAFAEKDIRANTSANIWPIDAKTFGTINKETEKDTLNSRLVGSLGVHKTLKKGETTSVNYTIGWHFPNVCDKLKKLVADANEGFYYSSIYPDALAVTKHIASNFAYLNSNTRLWQETWQGSTLPDWFLERTIIPVNTLATANTYRFKSGRFWSWEGVGACAGTCTHVWQYAQAMGRIFPALERDTRERVDLGTGFISTTGGILFRGENEKRAAIDGQAGTILRFYREHQMSADDRFLKKNWDKIKMAIQFMLSQDKNGDGMNDTPLENTLDAVWEGEIAWIVGLCVAAARAAEQMALEVKDDAFASACRKYAEAGCSNMKQYLFNGEYFIHRPDPIQGRAKIGSYNTCHIDQVYGQSWAYQVGLGQVLDRDSVNTALKSLWKYNFTMDAGPYIKTHIGGRPYVLPGEGGMIMNTNPKNEDKPYGNSGKDWQVGYFHEAMTGFEHQVAAHYMAEGMVDEALIVTRVIHERYHAAKRNPYNEIECSDHYARAMASYGTFISACGYEYHGPKKYISFNPKLGFNNFKASFTAAEGWGQYSQTVSSNKQIHTLDLKFGKLVLEKMAFHLKDISKPSMVKVSLQGKAIKSEFKVEGNRVSIKLNQDITVLKGQLLNIEIL